MLNTETIVDGYDLTFDPGDPRNASLYLCTVRGSGVDQDLVAAMRAADLWSSEPEKTVPDAQREAYKEGLDFVAAQAYRRGEAHVVIARFDHPRFPSDAGRWRDWLAFFDERLERPQG